MTSLPHALCVAALVVATWPTSALAQALQFGGSASIVDRVDVPATSAEPESAEEFTDANEPGEALRRDAISQESRSLGSPDDIAVRGSEPEGSSHTKQPNDRRFNAFGTLRSDIWQTVSALAFVLGLILVVRRLLVRGGRGLSGGGRPSGVLEILARYPVARGQQLILLKLARRILLVHQNGSAMSPLAELTDKDEVAGLLGRIEAGTTSPHEAARFRTLLQQFSREHDAASPQRGESGIRDAWETRENTIVDLTRGRASVLDWLPGLGGGRRGR